MNAIDIFPWHDSFNTGLPEIDAQHRVLVGLLNELASHVAFSSDYSELGRIIDELLAYTDYHFRTEEAVWLEYLPDDPDTVEHLAGHHRFARVVRRLEIAQEDQPRARVAEEALGFLARWLAAHILETDRHLAYVVLAMREGLPPEAARVRAREQMSGATKYLIDIILSIYGALSTNTLRLMREIAEHKEAEGEMRDARRMVEAAVSAGNVFPWVWDVMADRLTWGVSPEGLLGALPADASGYRDFRELVHDEDRAAFIAAGRAALAREGPYSCEFRIVTTDGDVRWVAARGRSEAVGGQVVRMIGASVDITDRKLAEDALERANRLLHEAIDSVAEGFTIYDEQDRLVICNEAYRKIYQTSRDLIAPGTSFSEIVRQGALRGQYKEAVGRIDEWVAERVSTHQRADGLPLEQLLDDGRWLLIIEHRTPSGFIVGNRIDITARKRAEAELAAYRRHLERLVAERTADLELAKSAAEAANVAKSAFLANVSHEIRTPLNAITGFSALIRRAGLNPRQGEWLDKHDVAVSHLIEIIDAVLDLSKIEAGKLVLEQRGVQLSSIVENVVTMMRVRAEEKGLALKAEVATFSARFVGDVTRITQGLLNYVSNAIKFTEHGSILIRVLIEQATERDAMVRFEVVDTGIGIPSEAMQRLFSAFEQADNTMTRKYGGTGLGLAITRKLAEAMGGSAGANSTPGVGSTFWFTIRLPFGGQSDGDYQESLDAEARLKQEFAGRSILLVEDDSINREVALELMTDCAMAVDTAEDGEQAVRKIAGGKHYDLIVMDLQMPRLGGLEATREIRQMPGGRGVPILAMTANVFADDRARCLAAGMDDFIPKPVSADTLFEKLVKWLSLRTGKPS